MWTASSIWMPAESMLAMLPQNALRALLSSKVSALVVILPSTWVALLGVCATAGAPQSTFY
jgi:hypothetical protein